MDLVSVLDSVDTCPVLGKSIEEKQYITLDLSVSRGAGFPTQAIKQLEIKLDELRNQHPKCIPYGGYLERRGIYQSAHFDHGLQAPRCIHLGVDLWLEASTPIYAPLDGVVHSFQYNRAALDYGYTIILQHSLADFTFYTLYGHLSDSNFDFLQNGQHVTIGSQFCTLGNENQNGGWPPHLHFQIIYNMEGYHGDYPGVVTVEEAEKYSHLCPNPTRLALGF